jgi:hypothetical protein
MNKNQSLEQKYNSTRVNLLLIVILTAVNIVLYFTGSETMMLFSASVPYYAVIFGSAMPLPILSIPCYAVAGICILVYLLCWIFSKKRSGWLVVALIFFVVDTIAMLGLYIWAQDFSGILDIALHAYILYSLFVGVSAGKQLKNMPAEEVQATEEEGAELSNSTPLRRIGDEEKVRVLLEETYGTYHICYRRVKRLNQLVINNYIYDEVEYLAEPPHSLSAVMNGTRIEVGYDGVKSYISIDGKRIKEKIRWY